MTRKEEIKQKISQLQNELKAIEAEEMQITREQERKNHKECIVCKNRIKECDFFITDGIVCNHPSNQEGKNKYKCYSHTCEFWEYDK